MNLLIIHWTLYRHVEKNFPDPQKTGREALYRWIFTMRVLENDMILRLCRLDDDDKSKHCLREALKAVRLLMPDAEAKNLDKHLKAYRASINPLKIQARNWCIAHLAKGAEESLTPQFQLLDVIIEAVGIADAIAAEEIEYTFRPSKHDTVIRLRDYLEKPESGSPYPKAIQ
ncbi:MAG: hypothetical protein ABI042_07185 [Verrucomicrobiota bacterium]